MFKQMRKVISIIILVAFIATSIKSPAYAQMASVDPMPRMAIPGVMVHLSSEFTPAYLKGIVIHPENALKFDFIIYKGDKPLTDAQKRVEYTKLTKYFLASLAIPDDDQWVNLSPYEKDRIIKDDFGKTEMGRDLLAQDYMLKQITASLIYPEDNLGKKFWDKVYSEAQKQYGTTEIPVNTFNKVWILPDDALIYEKGNTAYVLKNHLRVMLEEDYLSLQKHSGIQRAPINRIHTIASKIVKEIVLPELEREVNEGANFAAVRQVYSGMLLATWYKRVLKESLLSKIYANKSKVKGVDQDPKTNEEIYRRYLRAYKKGVFNYIKEDVDKYTNETIQRKYFSGGGESIEMYAESAGIPVLGPVNSKAVVKRTGVLTVGQSEAMITQEGSLDAASVVAGESEGDPQARPIPIEVIQNGFTHAVSNLRPVVGGVIVIAAMENNRLHEIGLAHHAASNIYHRISSVTLSTEGVQAEVMLAAEVLSRSFGLEGGLREAVAIQHVLSFRVRLAPIQAGVIVAAALLRQVMISREDAITEAMKIRKAVIRSGLQGASDDVKAGVIVAAALLRQMFGQEDALAEAISMQQAVQNLDKQIQGGVVVAAALFRRQRFTQEGAIAAAIMIQEQVSNLRPEVQREAIIAVAMLNTNFNGSISSDDVMKVRVGGGVFDFRKVQRIVRFLSAHTGEVTSLAAQYVKENHLAVGANESVQYIMGRSITALGLVNPINEEEGTDFDSTRRPNPLTIGGLQGGIRQIVPGVGSVRSFLNRLVAASPAMITDSITRPGPGTLIAGKEVELKRSKVRFKEGQTTFEVDIKDGGARASVLMNMVPIGEAVEGTSFPIENGVTVIVRDKHVFLISSQSKNYDAAITTSPQKLAILLNNPGGTLDLGAINDEINSLMETGSSKELFSAADALNARMKEGDLVDHESQFSSRWGEELKGSAELAAAFDSARKLYRDEIPQKVPITASVTTEDSAMANRLRPVSSKSTAALMAFLALLSFSSTAKANQTTPHHAAVYGGIDFNAANLHLQIKRDGNGVPLPISQQNLENIHIDGLIPIITDIRPAATLPIFTQLQTHG